MLLAVVTGGDDGVVVLYTEDVMNYQRGKETQTPVRDQGVNDVFNRFEKGEQVEDELAKKALEDMAKTWEEEELPSAEELLGHQGIEWSET